MMNHTPDHKDGIMERTAAAKSELTRDGHSMSWKLSDVKAATRRRGRARIAKPGTVFTSDPQACAPSYHYTGTTRS